jgi:periplasmic divalent cation tolerance protein
MKSAAKFYLVLVTAPDLKTARLLARAALQARLVACVNLIPKVESHYWWQGKVQSGAEVLLILKTSRTRLAALEKLVISRHPYDTPEFLAIPLGHGNRKYLAWLAAFWEPFVNP